MLEAVFELLLNVICYKVVAISIKLIIFGRFSPSETNAKYPDAMPLIGLIEIIAAIIAVVFIMKA